MKRSCLYRIKQLRFILFFRALERRPENRSAPLTATEGENKPVLSPAEHKVAKKRQEKEQILS